jgi:hypothetical protein
MLIEQDPAVSKPCRKNVEQEQKPQNGNRAEEAGITGTVNSSFARSHSDPVPWLRLMIIIGIYPKASAAFNRGKNAALCEQQKLESVISTHYV